MKNVIIVQENTHFSIDWLQAKIPNDFIMHILAKPNVIDMMTKNYNLSLFKIYKASETLNYEDIYNFALEVKKTLGLNDELQIVTNEEFMLVPCGHVRKALGLKGDAPEDLIIFRDKTIMKQYLLNTQAAKYLPKFKRFVAGDYKENHDEYIDNLIAEIPFPIFVKPVDLAGARKTGILSNREMLNNWLDQNINNDQSFEFNEYLTGDLYHIDSAVQDNKIIFLGVGRNVYPCHEFLDGKSNGTIIISKESEEFKKLSLANEEILKQYSNLPSGVFHLEVYMNAEGKIKFVEIAARPAGATIPRAYEHIYDVNILMLHYQLQLGLQPTINAYSNNRQFAYLIYPVVFGNTLFTHPLPKLECNYEYTPFQREPINTDDKIKSIHEKSALLVLTHTNFETINHEFIKMGNFRPISTASVNQNVAEPRINLFEEKDNGDNMSAISKSISLNVISLFDKHRINYTVLKHAPAVSCVDASNARGTSVHSAGKSMLLHCKVTRNQRAFKLAVLPGDMVINLEEVAKHFNFKSASIASADDVMKMLGCEIGTVPPFSFNEDIPVIVDSALIKDNLYIYHGHGIIDQSIKLLATDYQKIVTSHKNWEIFSFASLPKVMAQASVVTNGKNMPTSNITLAEDKEQKPSFTTVNISQTNLFAPQLKNHLISSSANADQPASDNTRKSNMPV